MKKKRNLELQIDKNMTLNGIYGNNIRHAVILNLSLIQFEVYFTWPAYQTTAPSHTL